MGSESGWRSFSSHRSSLPAIDHSSIDIVKVVLLDGRDAVCPDGNGEPDKQSTSDCVSYAIWLASTLESG